MRTIKFNGTYFLLTIILLLLEIFIALLVHDDFVRPHVGDFLVVILMYCFVKSFINTPVVPTAIGVLLFAYAIETAQYFNIVKRLGLQHSKFASTIIGTSFEWTDIWAYTIGVIVIIGAEKIVQPKK